MKKKALIKILAAPEDQEKLLGVFEHLRSSGVKIFAWVAVVRRPSRR